MAGEVSKKNVLEFRLTPKKAEQQIKQLAGASENVILGYHTGERQDERDIFDEDVFRILRTGVVMEQPTKTARGEWKCKMVKRLRGNRDAGAVTIIMLNGKLFVKTVEWEDLK
ncbi:hypothetical protein [Azospirillum sp. TSO35-2]|uniref:hypothetical protein n=1 Tax=Azospirillum sp. TSO35-2 TaxID=716796 RepID=UPI000D6133F6|nr:hypothetical protein [Azospirillum sp. TSO35-2]PWC39278.1 hypothetical protein TSO352_03535 [Azospirillum sp. TSO35-2]